MKQITARIRTAPLLILIPLLAAGCAVMSYTSPEGERFSRFALGTRTAVSSLEVTTHTNGTRSVAVQGYNADGATAMGVVTEAAVRAALTNSH